MLSIPLPTYHVLVSPGSLDSIGEVAHEVARAHRYVIVSDSNVAPLYAARVVASFGGERVDTLRVPAGEEHKTRESWTRLTGEMLAAGCGRHTTLVALGGG